MVERELGTEAIGILKRQLPGHCPLSNELNKTQESTFIFDQSLSIKERLKMKQQQMKLKKNSCAFVSQQELLDIQGLRKFSESNALCQKVVTEKKAFLLKEIEEMKRKIEDLGQKIKVQKSKTSSEKCLAKSKKYHPLNRIPLLLDEEIRAFVHDIDEYQRASFPMNQRVFQNMASLLKKNFKLQLSICFSGSLTTNLFTPSSNLNLLISYQYKKFDKEKQNLFVRNINGFYKTLQQAPWAGKVSLEMKKYLSIINFSLNDNNRSQNIELIFIYFQNDQQLSKDQTVKQFLHEFPMLRPLYFLTRKMFEPHGLTNPQKGGLKSICWIYLIVAFLKEFRKGRKLEEMGVGEIFLNYLYFYSHSFNHRTHFIQVSPQNEESFFLKNPSHSFVQKELVIMDHQKNNIILTKVFKNSLLLKSIFKYTYTTLYRQCVCRRQVGRQERVEEGVKGNLFKLPDDGEISELENPIEKFREIVVSYIRKTTPGDGELLRICVSGEGG